MTDPDDILIRIDVSTGFRAPTRYECRVSHFVVQDAVDSVRVTDAECCCVSHRGSPCVYCRAPMRLIDFETGEDAVS